MTDEVLSDPSTSRPTSPVPSLPQTLPLQRNAQPAFRFTWDRKRGPGSVSNFSEVESRADYVGNLNAARGEIQGLNDASVRLDALGAGWSSAKHGFHAISTVLNHPTKRAAPPKAHSTLPTVPPADLPRVRRKDFDPYLKDIGPQWDTFQRALAQSTRERSSSITAIDDLDPDAVPISPMSPSTSMASRVSRARPMPSLESVPSIFFDPDFNLTNPATFSQVAEMKVTSNDPQGLLLEQDPASISYSVPLLEKLSHYADTVEGHLVQEIQARSSSFFSALTNLHDLQSESERCLRRISDLKSMLSQIDEKGAKKGLELVREDVKITHLRRLEDGVKLVKDVNEMRTIAKGLAGAGEWSDALNVVENVRALMDYKPSGILPTDSGITKRLSTVGEEESNSPILPPVDTTKLPAALQDVSLRSLQAFSSLPTELRTLSTQIASTLADEFAAVTRQDLSYRTEAMSEAEGAKREDEQMLKERLTPLVMGLMRTGDGGIKDGLERWREVVMTEIRSAVKQHIDFLTNNGDDDDADALREASKSPLLNKPLPDKPLAAKTATLAQALVEMNHDDFLAVMRRIYTSLLSCLKGAKVQSGVIMEVVEDQSSRNRLSSPKSPTISTKHADPSSTLSTTLQSTIDSVLFAATELAHSRVSKLIATRAEQHSQLKLFEFYTFYEDSWNFVVNCEVVCKKMVVALRGTLGGQSKAFLQAFHADKLTKSAKWVEQEEWKAIEVSARSQRVADLIVSSAVGDPPETVFTKSADGVVKMTDLRPSDSGSPAISPGLDTEVKVLTNGSSNPDAGNAGSPQANGGGEAARAKCLMIEDRSFYVVAASLQVMGLIIDYLKVMVNLHGVTMECMSRLVEFLKAFNSRTCQVVLGAGAIRSAGLKNITARHLAFASQSLSIMISFIPYIREAFRRHLDPKQFVLLTEFDKLKRDYQEHQYEIHAKLVTIMGDVMTGYIKSLHEVQWDSPQEIAGPNDYMQGLVKQTVTLYKVLSKFLGPTTTEPIMSEAFAMINHRLGEEYQKVVLPSVDAKERMLTDARFLHEKLSALRGVGSLNNMVVTIVQEKPVVPPNAVQISNGVANGVNQGSSLPTSSTPRPRGSIDLQAQPRSATRQSTLGTLSNNLAARPSPFAKRTLANLFGGDATPNSANSSSTSLASAPGSGMGLQEGSSTLGTPQLHAGGLAIGSSGGVTPEMMDGRASPVTLPSSPPRNLGSTAFNPANKGFKAVGGADDTLQENDVGPQDQGTGPSDGLRAREENNS